MFLGLAQIRSNCYNIIKYLGKGSFDMFRNILIFAMFATAAGYCFAAEFLPQVVTSEVFYEQEKTVTKLFEKDEKLCVKAVVECVCIINGKLGTHEAFDKILPSDS